MQRSFKMRRSYKNSSTRQIQNGANRAWKRGRTGKTRRPGKTEKGRNLAAGKRKANSRGRIAKGKRRGRTLRRCWKARKGRNRKTKFTFNLRRSKQKSGTAASKRPTTRRQSCKNGQKRDFQEILDEISKC